MNIIELAKQAGFQDADWNYIKGLEKFANLVAAQEREECAKLMFRLDLCGEEVKAAEAIRARGTT
jgi:hypothetical protein